jgi:hypothetical protein
MRQRLAFVSDPLLAEREHLQHARRCLEAMRETVRTLGPQGGDRVSTEYLQAASSAATTTSVVEPARMAAVRRGLNWLHVALTRAVTSPDRAPRQSAPPRVER